MKKLISGILILLILIIVKSNLALATTTKVGNGDNGSDLEGFTPIKSGPIVTSRKQAIQLLKKLNTASIRGLGDLIPEVTNTKLFITKKDITDLELKALGGFETDMRGFIYARTFSRPHAATRFFPVSSTLNKDQLVALHIHEGLHRSLHINIRENEAIVTKITLAITAPGATRDSITSITNKYIPKHDNENLATNYFLDEDAMKRNVISYKVVGFSGNSNNSPNSAHVIASKLYPFGGSMSAVGLGLQVSYLLGSDNNSELGPLGISLVGKLNTPTRFKFYWYGEANFSASDNTHWSNSHLNRDTLKLGIKMHTLQTDTMVLTNSLQYTLPSKSKDTAHPIEYEHGGIISAKIDLKKRVFSNFGLGGFLEYSIADEMTYTQGSITNVAYDRDRVATIGPEVAWLGEQFSVIIFSSFVLNSDENFELDRFGDILHYGAGKQNIGLKMNYLW